MSTRTLTEPRKYGEVFRLMTGDATYILVAHKHDWGQLTVPWLDLFITRKTTRAIRGDAYKRLSKEDRAYNLVGETSVSVVRALVEGVQEYLDSVNPETVAICPHWDRSVDRFRFYERQMNRMGWNAIGKERPGNGQDIIYFSRAG